MTVLENYKLRQKQWKASIRLRGNHWYSWLWYFIAFSFVWIFYNIRDWRTAIIFIIVLVVVSSEVWVPYMIALIFWYNESLRITMLSVASACWLFWLGPGTPFLVICITLTIAIKSLFNRRKKK